MAEFSVEKSKPHKYLQNSQIIAFSFVINAIISLWINIINKKIQSDLFSKANLQIVQFLICYPQHQLAFLGIWCYFQYRFRIDTYGKL